MARRRRAPIASTITVYRFATPDRLARGNELRIIPGREGIGTRANPQRVTIGTVHLQPEPTRADRDQAIVAAHGGQRPTHATSWDQDN
jgi:hypothetical protein